MKKLLSFIGLVFAVSLMGGAAAEAAPSYGHYEYYPSFWGDLRGMCALSTPPGGYLLNLKHSWAEERLHSYPYNPWDLQETTKFGTYIPAGNYKVTLQSWDGYQPPEQNPGREGTTPQVNETIELILADGSGTIATSNKTTDLVDYQREVSDISVVNSSLTLSRPATIYYARHGYIMPYYVSNSVFAVCATLEPLPTYVPVSVDLNATPSNPSYDGGSTIEWDITGDVDSCTITDGGAGTALNGLVVSSDGNQTVNNFTSNVTYTINCTGLDGGSDSDTASVNPGAAVPPIVIVNVSDNNPAAGGNITVSWDTTTGGPVSSCTVTGDWPSSPTPVPGSNSMAHTNLTAEASYTYEIECTGPDGQTHSDSETVSVGMLAPSVTMGVVGGDTTPSYNSRSNLTWTVANASSCVAGSAALSALTGPSISPVDGGVQTGYLTDTVSGYYYQIVCTNAEGASDSANITLTPNAPAAPTVSINACELGGAGCVGSGTKELPSGGEAEIAWSVDSGTADWCGVTTGGAYGFGVVGLSGGTDITITEPAYGNTYEFGVQCKYGPSYSADTRVSLTMGASAPTITANGGGDNIRVRSDETVTISWDATDSDPATCSVTGGGYTNNPLASQTGNTDVTILGTTTFTIDCGANGTDSVTVELIPSVFES